MSSDTYAAAKYFGVRVEQFAIGFGKRLIGFRRGETDYRINILPLGGYVKMSGENPMDERTGDPGEFLSHPRWQRFIVALAGPAMNIFLAIALLTGVYMVHFEYPVSLDGPAFVGWVNPNTPAEKPGSRLATRLSHRRRLRSHLGADRSQGSAQSQSASEFLHRTRWQNYR